MTSFTTSISLAASVMCVGFWAVTLFWWLPRLVRRQVASQLQDLRVTLRVLGHGDVEAEVAGHERLNSPPAHPLRH